MGGVRRGDVVQKAKGPAPCRDLRLPQTGSLGSSSSFAVLIILAYPGLKGTGLRFSSCSLIKLLFSNLSLILWINNPTHVYLSDLRCISKKKCISEWPEVGWRSTKVAENISGLCQHYQRWIYCWPEGFIPWLINFNYLHLSWSSDCQESVRIGSLTTLWHDHIAFIDDIACPGRKTRKTAFWLTSMRWTMNLSL